ncbi:MAG: 2-C-methyl-D-erythritol 2,4-cyclodiphosphate synthase [Candidatus Lambdaproteobacteria bacterium RIFOXYD2_FULL_50_16]|uniref:2-C-methyl-D-erythritol 2,4-cyclodiphosphate synthase n=1 Tax=Candidatus Lambdaproteobacteria bacterium RIFOXYD2_FULL_50_16 TaxID=1817772 RepID=A0A1F6G6B9_9PROT|nr:MAG: 2-C-methyl-D-erythritol 2,4-cyclodiphosphate synthase [Candidatus Lambdaproteobacteria bacterium RIFOXYD2_FULL_50_16]
MPEFRIGQGYDVHRLVAGRKLIIGGVEIEHSTGLLGHSDADVLAHAMIDAFLGAAGLGDIGGLFPDTDPAYAGADSMVLMQAAWAEVQAQGWRLINLDSTILAQKPKMKPHIEAMRKRLAEVLGVKPTQIGVKATTTEGLGFVGEEKGIAAQAVALLER